MEIFQSFLGSLNLKAIFPITKFDYSFFLFDGMLECLFGLFQWQAHEKCRIPSPRAHRL